MKNHHLHHHKVHQSIGLLVIIIVSALFLFYFWLRSGTTAESVQQVPNDIKNLKVLNEELRRQGLTPIQF
jgi:NADH:ubiquinone oxidoreductase subunit 6 (subunit J)